MNNTSQLSKFCRSELKEKKMKKQSLQLMLLFRSVLFVFDHYIIHCLRELIIKRIFPFEKTKKQGRFHGNETATNSVRCTVTERLPHLLDICNSNKRIIKSTTIFLVRTDSIAGFQSVYIAIHYILCIDLNAIRE